MTQKIMFQFPGQGSQAVGMGGSLAEAFPVARAAFEEVNDALGEDLFRLMQDGPEDDLRLTRNAQPALFAASMACLLYTSPSPRDDELSRMPSSA